MLRLWEETKWTGEWGVILPNGSRKVLVPRRKRSKLEHWIEFLQRLDAIVWAATRIG